VWVRVECELARPPKNLSVSVSGLDDETLSVNVMWQKRIVGGSLMDGLDGLDGVD
jgi:hypothetical protein